MKNTLLKSSLRLLTAFLFVIILCTGCESGTIETRMTKVVSGNTTFGIVIIDGCEYVYNDYGCPNSILTHKGNCIYCQQRMNKLLLSLIKKDTINNYLIK